MKRYIAVFLILAGMTAMASGTVTTTDNTATYNCNGSATQFSFGFPIAGTDTSQLRVILRTAATGTETTLIETIDYSVSAVNNDYSGGGTVTTVQTYSSAYALSIVRATPVTQTADLSTKSSVNYASLESYFDKMIMVIQDLTQKLALTLTAPASDSGTSYEIPEAAIRAGKYLAFDSSGDPIASPGTAGPVAASAFGQSLVDDTDAAAARSTLELGYAAVYNIKDEDSMASDSPVHLATQQSIKAYIDAALQSQIDAEKIKNSRASMALAMDMAVNTSMSRFEMPGGVTDVYEDKTGVKTASSANETYVDSESRIKLLLHLDENMNLADKPKDYSAGNHTAASSTATRTGTSVFGTSALYYNGSTQYTEYADSDDWNICENGTDNWTIDFWVKPQNVPDGNGETIIGQYEDASNRWYITRQNTTGYLYFIAVIGGVTYNTTGDQRMINNSAWSHVALCKAGADIAVYLNGEKAGQVTLGSFASFTGSLFIAASNASTGFLEGFMDEIRIAKTNIFGADPTSSDPITVPAAPMVLRNEKFYKPALAGDVRFLSYHDTATADALNHQYLSGSVITKPPGGKYGEYNWNFNGAGNYIEYAYSEDWNICENNSDDWTIDFWTKQNHVGTEVYLSQYADASNYWQLFHVHGSGLIFRVADGGTTVIDTGYGGEITDINWHHIALVKKGQEYAVYLDGTQVNYVSDSSTKILNVSLGIGAYDAGGTPGNYLDGYLEHVRICKSNIFNASPDSGLTDTITIPADLDYYSNVENMTLISDTATAEAQPAKGYISILIDEVETITANTDITAEITCNGSVWDTAALSVQDLGGGMKRLTGSTAITAAGTNMQYRIKSLNNKNVHVHGVSILWD